MNPQDPLAQLHPLREPGLIGWWPLAPGWWVLIGLAVLLIAGLSYLAYRRYKARAYRRQALAQLEQLRSEWQSNEDANNYIASLNALLKSVAMRTFSSREVASCTGQEWVGFLNRTLPKYAAGKPFDEGLASAAYQPKALQMDLEGIHHTAARWIKRHGAKR